MKKAPTRNARAQDRRRRALDRFTIDPTRASKDADYAKRKAQEKSALEARLGQAAA
jgi:hypothetical protein